MDVRERRLQLLGSHGLPVLAPIEGVVAVVVHGGGGVLHAGILRDAGWSVKGVHRWNLFFLFWYFPY